MTTLDRAICIAAALLALAVGAVIVLTMPGCERNDFAQHLTDCRDVYWSGYGHGYDEAVSRLRLPTPCPTRNCGSPSLGQPPCPWHEAVTPWPSPTP